MTTGTDLSVREFRSSQKSLSRAQRKYKPTHRQRDLFRQGFDRFLHGELIKPKIFGDVVTVRFYPLLDPPGRGNMAEKNDVQASISDSPTENISL